LSDEAIRKTIMCELIKLGHNIKDALIKADIGNKFGIDKVEEIPNGKIMTFVNEYRIHFKNKNIISLKDSEAVRYGSLASKKDIAITHLGNREIVEFLNELDTFVQNKIVETQKIFKELDKKSLKRL